MKLIFITILWCSITPLVLIAQPMQKSSDPVNQKKSVLLKTGIRLHYIDSGAPARRPVVLLHGYTDTSRSYELLARELSLLSDQYRLIIPDLRGHGASSVPDSPGCRREPQKCFTPELFAEDVISLLDLLELKEVDVVGHSMGSIIAQAMAFSYPQRVRGMTLIGTIVSGRECGGITEFLQAELLEGTWKPFLQQKPGFQWPTDAFTIKPSQMGEDVMHFLRENWVTEPSASPALLKEIYRETIEVPLTTWIGAAAALAEFDHGERIQKLRVPVFILWATHDSLFDRVHQERVKEIFRNAARNTGVVVFYKEYGRPVTSSSDEGFNDLGHNFHWAASRAVAEDIHSFINHGYPLMGRPYCNPNNQYEILVDHTATAVVVLR
jgi:non-heme chloroperoxidase